MHFSKITVAQRAFKKAAQLAIKKVAHPAARSAAICALLMLAGCSEESEPPSVGSPPGNAAAVNDSAKTELAPTQLAPNHLAQRPPSQPLINPAETDHLPLWPPSTNGPSAPAPSVPPLFPVNPPPAPTEQPTTEFTPPAFTSPQFAPALPAAEPPSVPPPAFSDDNPLRGGSRGNPLRASMGSPELPTELPSSPETLLPPAPAESPPAVPLAPLPTVNESPAHEAVVSPPPLAALPKPLPRIVNKAASRPPRVPIHPKAHAEWTAKQKLAAAAAENPSGGSAHPADYDPSAFGPAPAPQPSMMELGHKQDPPEAMAIESAAPAEVPPASAVEVPPLPAFTPPTFDPAPAAAASEDAPAATLLAPPAASAPPSFEPPAFEIPEVPAVPAEPKAPERPKTTALVPTSSNDPFDVVRVFYGTDRLPELVNRDTFFMRAIRFSPAAILISLSVVGIGVVLVSRKITWIIGTSALIVCSIFSVWHGISEALEIAALAALEEPRYSADKNPHGRLERGICEVSIPKTHEPGEMETPSITRLEFEYDPAEHITLRKTVRLQNDAFYEQLREQVASSPNREVLVFVHGFNVSFEDAARRTAQMASDLKLQGAPVFFSWPADKYFLLTYGKDETSVSWAAPHLKEFLLDLVHNTDARAINLVAHSMGNRALTSALREIDLQLRDEARLFNQVVLAAPDIDADDFRDNIAPAIQRTAKQVTLYASKNDVALSASRLLHRNPRAGDTSQGLVLVPGVITIDVSNINGGPWGHSYYGASDPVLRDLHLLLTSLPPERRTWLNMKEQEGQTYWAFKPLTSGSEPALMTPR